MRTDSPRSHPTLPHVSDGERIDDSSSKIPPKHQVIADVCRILNFLRPTTILSINEGIKCTQTSQSAPPASIRPEDSTSGHLCEVCREGYSTMKKLRRHFNREHKDLSPCRVSGCTFRWKRPYLYRDHLESCHSDDPDIDPDEILGKSAGSRRKTRIIGRDIALPVSPPAVESPPEVESPPPVESEGQSSAESPHFPMTTPLPAATNVTYGPSPALSFVAHDFQPEGAEPAVAALNHDDVAFCLENARQIREEVYIFADEQEWSVHSFLYVTYVISDILCNQVVVSPPGGVHYCRHLSNPSTAVC